MNMPPFSGTELFTQSTDATLADLMGLVETAPFKTDPLTNETRRRRVLGSLGRMARILGKSPESLVLNEAFLDKVRKVKPRLHGIGKRSWENILVDFRYVCRELLGLPMGRNPAPMSPAWEALINPINDPERRRLYGFARWCSKNGIDPENVDDNVAARFRAHLETTSLKKPYHSYRVMARFWNEWGGIDPNWPTYRFELTDQRRTRTLPLEAFPASFAADIDHWARTNGEGDLLARLEDGPDRPLRASTIKGRRDQVLALASAAVRAGVPIETITDLERLVEVEVYRQGLVQLINEYGKVTSWVENIARGMLPIARHHVRVEPDHYGALSALRKKLALPFEGLTARNKARLLQFDDPKTLQRLLSLPEVIYTRLGKLDEINSVHARFAETALAIAILLAAPIRIQNLQGLNLESHVHRTRPPRQSRRSPVKILIPGKEVKNGEDISIPLPPDVVRFLDLFLKRYRPLLAPIHSPYLFSNRTTNRPLSKAQLGQRISELVLEEVGAEINPHMFRHLVAKIILDNVPGAYGLVKSALGHKSVHTTCRVYADHEQESAFVRHHDILETARRRPGQRGRH
jgi:integrase